MSLERILYVSWFIVLTGLNAKADFFLQSIVLTHKNQCPYRQCANNGAINPRQQMDLAVAECEKAIQSPACQEKFQNDPFAEKHRRHCDPDGLCDTFGIIGDADSGMRGCRQAFVDIYTDVVWPEDIRTFLQMISKMTATVGRMTLSGIQCSLEDPFCLAKGIRGYFDGQACVDNYARYYGFCQQLIGLGIFRGATAAISKGTKYLTQTKKNIAYQRMRDPKANTQREQFIRQYMNLNLVESGKAKAFLTMASQTLGAEDNDITFIVAKSDMKNLNALLQKDPASAVTRKAQEDLKVQLQKEINEGLEELKRQNPQLSDLKYTLDIDATNANGPSIYFAFKSPKILGDSQQLGKIVEKAVQKAWEKTYADASGYFKKGDFDSRFFFCGKGPNLEAACWAMHEARQAPTGFQDYDSPGFQENMKSRLNRFMDMSDSFEKRFTAYGLIDPKDHVLNQDVFELARQYKEPGTLAEALNRQGVAKVAITSDDAKAILEYNKTVNAFSVETLATQTQSPTMEVAEVAGASTDSKGLGANNLRTLAVQLRQSNGSLTHTQWLARKAEQTVTTKFKTINQKIHRATSGVLGKKFDVRSSSFSGDDGVQVYLERATDEEKQKLVNAYASEVKNIRGTFIDNIEVPAHRSILANDGEAIEKLLFEKVSSRLGRQRARDLTFFLDMQTRVPGEGSVKLIIGKGTATTISDRDYDLIYQDFEQAVYDYNKVKLQRNGWGYQPRWQRRFWN